MLELEHGGGCGALAKERISGCAGERPDPDEDQDREPGQNRNE
jgi:hypothetical protein